MKTTPEQAPTTHELSASLQRAKVRDRLAFSHMFDHACELEDRAINAEAKAIRWNEEFSLCQESCEKWKSIAYTLMRQCEFALGRLKADGWTGILIDTSGDNIEQRHWKEEMADAMELIPGVKVRRDAMYETRKKKGKR